MNNIHTDPDASDRETRFDRQAFSNVAQLSNILAKHLTGSRRTLAYRIKGQACSSLILTGNASVNGVWPGGILALDIAGGDHRLHIRRTHLTREAREIVDRQIEAVPAVARLEHILNAKKEK